MNEGRLWLFVRPTVGIPLFFIVIVFAVLAVHLTVMNRTTWYPALFQGNFPGPTSAETPSAVKAG